MYLFCKFGKLSRLNKEEYLSLSSVEFCPEWFSTSEMTDIIGADPRKVIDIFETNHFRKGLFLKMSRFNHSCRPNAEYFWNEETGFEDARAIRSIEKGEEITFSYDGAKCKDRDERRTHLKNNFQFHCMCEACEITEEEAEKDQEICNRYKALEVELKNIEGREEVNILKEMYKLAKTMKTLRMKTILEDILEIGFDSACQGFLNAREIALKQKFMQDVNSFTNAGVILSKRLFGESNVWAKNWVKRKNNPIQYFLRYANTKLVLSQETRR